MKILEYLKYSILYLILILGLFIIDFLNISQSTKENLLKIDKSLLVFFLGFPIIQNIISFIENKLMIRDEEFAGASIIRNIIKIAVFLILILIILNIFNISITPILTTLGIGGLAVALAFQDTLSDFFSGFYLIALKQIKIGDYIELDSGERGYVSDINWRNTQIRALGDNLILIPNAKIMKTKIINYNLPAKEMSVVVQVGVHYSSDLDFVEKISIEVAKDVLQNVDGGVRDFEPFIRYHTFSSSSINFSVILRIQEFVNQYLIIHEFIKKLQKRYKQENIVIPFPIVAVNYEQEK